MKHPNQRRPSSAVDQAPPALVRAPLGRREVILVAAMVVAGIALRFADPGRISVEQWDEGVYASNLLADGEYPMRHLYAPPLLPAIIEWTMILLGPTSFAAVLPGLILGSLTVPLCWWAARQWFGPAAGIAAAALAAFSDVHILFSRTALTDGPLCFWFLLSVYFAWRAMVLLDYRAAIAAGLAAGAAWSTKYNGWLTLAVIVSGLLAWGLFERLDRREWTARLSIAGVIVLVAAVCWSPVWYWLQPAGGYAAVAKNHAGYFVGLAGWPESFARQVANLCFLDSWLAPAGIALALLLPAIVRWRIELAGLFGLLAFGAGSVVAIAGGSIAGLSALIPAGGWMQRPPRESRPRRLALWLVAAWTISLFVAVPAYTPYSRLALPWVVAAWLATAAAFGMALGEESATDKTAPKDVAPNDAHRVRPRALAAIAISLIAVTAGLRQFNFRLQHGASIPALQDRTARARTILQAAREATEPLGAAGRADAVFLVYGEPAIYFHLQSHGYEAHPVIGFELLAAKTLTHPAFVVAYATSEFERRIAPFLDRVKLLATYHDTPSDLVLLEKFAPADLMGPQGRPQEELRLYRVQ
jgi:4-amino-4-deoxy-L-arabinose transferase-like glycosyltransferase